MNNQKLKLEEYTEDEIMEILNNNERLVIFILVMVAVFIFFKRWQWPQN